jgi:hypothetical protein
VSAARNLADLRIELERRFGSAMLPAPGTAPSEQASGLRVGVRGIDRLLPGGVPRGALSLWIGEGTSGRTAALRLLVESAVTDGALVGLVDATRTLDAADWCAPDGTALPGLWIARPPADVDPADGAWVAEHLLRAGAFALVILDGPALTAGEAHRLRALARDVGTALVVSTDGDPGWRADVQVEFRRLSGTQPGLYAGGRYRRRAVVRVPRAGGRRHAEGEVEVVHVPPNLLDGLSTGPDRRRGREGDER